MATEAVGRPHPEVRERARPKSKRRRGPGVWRQVLVWASVVLIIVFCLFPIYWIVNTSLKAGQDLSSGALLPPNPTLKNYDSIFSNDAFTKALRNSVIVSFLTTTISLIIGSFAAYALARLRFPLK